MQSLTPEFSLNAVCRDIDKFVNREMNEIFAVLSNVGQAFVESAKMTHSFTSQSGNLEASIGYIVLKNGIPVGSHIETPNQNVGFANTEIMNEVIAEVAGYPGYVLIVFAGMEYAAAVESKDYTVISQEVSGAETLLKELLAEIQ